MALFSLSLAIYNIRNVYLDSCDEFVDTELFIQIRL